MTLLNKHHYVDLFKNQQNLFCIGIHFVAYVSKFEDDPSQNTKYHFHPFRLKCSFLGFALWNSFHLFFIFRSSIFCGGDADDDDGDDDDDDGGGDDDDSK